MKPRTVILTVEIRDCTATIAALRQVDRIDLSNDDYCYMDRDPIERDPYSLGQIVQVSVNVAQPSKGKK